MIYNNKQWLIVDQPHELRYYFKYILIHDQTLQVGNIIIIIGGTGRRQRVIS